MIQAIALDDEPPALKVLENFCGQSDEINLLKTFTRPSEALKYLKKFPVDLIFLDIQMPSLSGIEFCKIVSQSTMVVFVTAHSEYAVEGFNLSALDYLLKPYTLDRFKQTIVKASEYLHFLSERKTSPVPYIFIRADYQLIKVNTSDILYVEGYDDYVKIVVKGEKTVVARLTMKGMQERLPSNEFIRVHRSYIIALNKIDSIKNKVLYIGGKEIPIGSSYEANLQNFLND